eukprot:scaffold34570_cov108-Skeletonema_dohrnii-CCMP3373.AAC.2
MQWNGSIFRISLRLNYHGNIPKAVAIELLKPACPTRFCDPLWHGRSLFRHLLLLSFCVRDRLDARLR